MSLLLSGCALLGVGTATPLSVSHDPGVEPSGASARLDLDGVEVVGGPVRPVSPAEIDDLEERLGIAMPAGYREYLTRLGDGHLCTLLRVMPPFAVLAGLEEHRGMMAVYWFWKPSGLAFGQDEAMASVLIADTLTGDPVVFWPDDPDHLYLLPRHGDRVVVRDADVLALAEWMCGGGLEDEPSRGRDFEPFDHSALPGRELPPPIEPDTPPPDPTRPPREVLAAYLDELAAVEAWAIDAAGGPEAVQGDTVPEEVFGSVSAEFEARLAGVHRRYCSPPVALVKRGSTSWLVPPEHGGYRILDEEQVSGDRVRILALNANRSPIHFTLDRTADGWRIVKEEIELF